jgi:hypothetical protein
MLQSEDYRFSIVSTNKREIPFSVFGCIRPFRRTDGHHRIDSQNPGNCKHQFVSTCRRDYPLHLPVSTHHEEDTQFFDCAHSRFHRGFFPFTPESILRLNSAGEIPTVLPKVHLDFFSVFSDFNEVVIIFEFALTLAFLGAIDSLLTLIVADNLTKTKHDSNQELIGQGIGNMVSGLLGGLPCAGATMRTVINIKSAAKSSSNT